MGEISQGMNIDYIKLIKALLKKWYLLAICAVLGGIVAYGYTKAYVEPVYNASALMYVNNSNISVSGTKVTISSSGSSKSLVDTYAVILKSRLTLETVIEKANLSLTYSQLYNMVSVGSENDTEIFRIRVSCNDPELACQIANTIVEVLPDKISSIVDGASVRTVDMAVIPATRSSPSYSKNTAVGMLVGFALCAAVIVLQNLLNDTLESENMLLDTFDGAIPLLATIPDLNERGSSGYSRYGKSNRYHYAYGYGYESGPAADGSSGKGKAG